MTSLYSEHGLSEHTIAAYKRYGADPKSTEERRFFYLSYLEDVLPIELTVHHTPSDPQPRELVAPDITHPREEIQVLYKGKIFMTCVVSMDHITKNVGNPAIQLAFRHWREKSCVADRDQSWGMFTCTDRMRFYKSHNGTEWEQEADLNPKLEAKEVAAYFREEYERVKAQEELAKEELPKKD